MTTLGGEYEPVEVQTLDLVGYVGKSKFVILQAVTLREKGLPAGLPEGGVLNGIPTCIRAKIVNNQVVNFSGVVATLHDINGEWFMKCQEGDGSIERLGEHRFFEIGDCK